MIRKPFVRAVVCLGAALPQLATSPSAYGQTFTYVGPSLGSWQTATNWVPFIPPSTVPPPGPGDFAIINSNSNVFLSGDVNALIGLALANNGDLMTNGWQLQVLNANQDAPTNVVGTGSTGNNTVFIVQPNTHGGLGSVGFEGGVLNLTNGAELDMVSGGSKVRLWNKLNLDGSSIITGNGSIGVLNAEGDILFDLEGTIRPDNGTLTLNSNGGKIDLDGSNPSNNLLDVTSPGAGLTILGPINDAFSGEMRIGSGNQVEFNYPWTLAGGSNYLIFDSEDGTGVLKGALGLGLTVGGAGFNYGRILVDSGVGQIIDDVTFESNTQVTIDLGSSLELDDPGGIEHTTTFRGGSYVGAGTLLPAAQNNVMAPTTIAVSTIDLDGSNDRPSNWSITQPLALNVESIEAQGGNVFGNFVGAEPGIVITSQQVGSGGRLTVNLPTGDSWTLASVATIDIVGSDGLAAIHLAGSELIVEGTVNVDGISLFDAPINLAQTGQIHLVDSNSVLRVQADSALRGGTIDGDGNFGSQSAVVVGHGLIETDITFSSTSELWADDGTLEINGNITDLGAFVGTASDTGVLEVNENWSTNLAGEVRLNGGEITGDGTVNNGGVIRGHGLVSSNAVYNIGLIAADGGILEIAAPMEWDSVGPACCSGELEAEDGDLLISGEVDGLPLSSPTFFGVIRIAEPHTFTFETGGANDEIEFGRTPGDFGQLDMDGGTLIADVVIHKGEFTIEKVPATIVAHEMRFADVGLTTLDSDLHLDTTGGGSAVIAAGATISGRGSLINIAGSRLFIMDGVDVDAHLVNEGSLELNGSPLLPSVASPATVELSTFRQSISGDFVVEIFGTDLDEFDRLLADTGASLNGTLSAFLADGFEAEVGDVFEFISAGGAGVAGTFAVEQIPNVATGIGMFVRYTSNAVALVTTFTADFDLDLDVDADDLTIWQTFYSAGPGALHGQGDADGNGLVTGRDFLIWQRQYGNSYKPLASSAAVPEPTSGLLFAVVFAGWYVKRQLRRPQTMRRSRKRHA